ncbi:MAG TPA: hypothetical protein VF719_10795 [Abditibacteriaceae bacterium]|jgi:hypothetical protein
MLQQICALVENGRYTIGRHAEFHMMEEGFEKEHCVGAVLGGRLLERYPAENRYLIAGRFHLSARNVCPLHVVCEITAASRSQFGQLLDEIPSRATRGSDGKVEVVCFVTAYIPRPPDWISPHVRAT